MKRSPSGVPPPPTTQPPPSVARVPTGGALPKASSTSHVGGTPAPPSTAPTVAATAHTPNPGAAPPHISAGGNAGVSVSASAAQPEQPRRRQHQFWRLDAELMIDGFSAAPIKDATLVFAVGSRRGTGAISYAGPRASAPPAPEQGYAVHKQVRVLMPGLWDCHVHLLGLCTASLSTELLNTDKALLGARSALCLQAALEAGFTSVRELGGLGLNLRRGSEDGSLPLSPHIYACGYVLTITGGHGDFHDMDLEITHKLQHALFGSDLAICDGPWEARKAVRAQLRRNADVIKVMATGGVLSKYDNPHHQEFTNDELSAIVHEASMKGRAVAAHCHGEAGIRAALEAGALTVEHATYLTEDLCDLMVAKGALLVPTLYVVRRLLEVGEKSGMMAESISKLRRVAQDHQAAIRLALRKGVRIACGTDIFSHGERSPVPWGEHAKELELLVEAGMTPMQAIIAATSNGPESLGPRAPQSGRLAAGYDADFLVLARDPLEDITMLQNKQDILAVFKDGNLLVDRGLFFF